MNGPVYWIDTAPEVDERAGLFFLVVRSGSEVFSFSMASKNAGFLSHRARKAFERFLARKCEIVPLSAARLGKRPRTKSKTPRSE